MMRELILYVGNVEEYRELIQHLERWSIQQSAINFHAKSVHSTPNEVLALRITRLPALIFEGQLIAQGEPMSWIPYFLDQILSL